ncbi:MAG: hypothetical protein L0H59_11920 [Tomitella sp.]|nr:hypothetical protein [Tomitella sp.]
MGRSRVPRAGLVVGGAAVLVGVALAGCAGHAPPPTNAELQQITLPSPVLPPNASSQAGTCGLLTGAEVRQETGVSVDRTSVVADGCIWQGFSDGSQPIVDIRVIGDRDGNITRVYNEVRSNAEDSGPVRQIDGIGDRAFATDTAAPTVWWAQAGQVYGLSIMVTQDASQGDQATAALDLARLAASRIGE